METKPPSLFGDLDIDPNKEVDVFIDDKTFTVTMSGFFAKRLQGVGDWLMRSEDPEKILQAYNSILEKPNEQPADLLSFNIQTFLMLMKEIEKCAIEQEATKKTKFGDIQQSIENTAEVITKLDTSLDGQT